MLKSWTAPIRLGLGRALLVSALVGLIDAPESILFDLK